MRRRLRDPQREPRAVPAKDTALFHGAAIELSRMGGVLAVRDAEIARLRSLLVNNGIDPDEKP